MIEKKELFWDFHIVDTMNFRGSADSQFGYVGCTDEWGETRLLFDYKEAHIIMWHWEFWVRGWDI